MTERTTPPSEGGTKGPSLGERVALMRDRAVAFTGALAADFRDGVVDGVRDWIDPPESARGEELAEYTWRPDTLQSLYDLNKTQAELSEADLLDIWTGPTGFVVTRELDDVVAAAVLTGGRIPLNVELSFNDRAVVTAALGVLGFPIGPVAFGSTVEQRRRVGLTGPAMGTGDNITWLPDERTVLESLEYHTSVTGLILSAAIFEHMHPDDIRGKIQARLQRGARFSGPGSSDSAREFEVPRNADEKELFDYANGIIAEAYGDHMVRFSPGSMAPMLLARAFELLGARRETPRALAAVLAMHYRESWRINDMHHTGYPPEMEGLYHRLLLVDGRGRHQARIELEAQAKLTGRRVSEAEVDVLARRYTQEYQLDYLAEEARIYRATRAKELHDAREAQAKAHQEVIEKEWREYGYDRYIERGAYNYGLALVTDPDVVFTAGQKAIADNDIQRVIRATMALYERAEMGERQAAESYATLRGLALVPMLSYLVHEDERIAAGFISPEEALLIVSEMDVSHTDAHTTAMIRGLYEDLHQGLFPDKYVESRTGGGSDLHPATETIDLPSRYHPRLKAIMTIVSTTERLEKSMLMFMRTKKGSELRWNDPWMRQLRASRHIRAVEAFDQQVPPEVPLSTRQMFALKHELSQIAEWRKAFRTGTIRQTVGNAHSFLLRRKESVAAAVATGSWTKH